MNQDQIVAELVKGVATLGQLLTRFMPPTSWRVVECASCLNTAGDRVRLVEITLPDGPVVYVNITEHDVISNGRVETLPGPPTQITRPEQILAWLSGISYAG